PALFAAPLLKRLVPPALYTLSLHDALPIFAGIEVDILDDGSLDQTEEMLGRLDLVTASVHSKLKMGRDAMTRRMVAAVSNPRVKDRKSTRLNSSHVKISYAVFCLKKKKQKT